MSDQSLIVLSGWDITIPPTAEQARTQLLASLDAVDFAGDIPADKLGQSIADEIAAAMGQASAWMAGLENLSATLRKPYFDQAKAIKKASDDFVLPLGSKLQKLGAKLNEFEAEKKRVEIELNRQREADAAAKRREEEARQWAAEQERRKQEQAERDRLAAIEADRQWKELEARKAIEAEEAKARDAKTAADRAAAEKRRAELEATNARLKAECDAANAAERDRQAKAEAERAQARQNEQLTLAEASTVVRYEAPTTAGVRAKVVWEFEVVDQRKLAEFCWANRRAWINRIEFFSRDITAYINSDDADREIPGLIVRQVVGTNVKKAKQARAINVTSSVVPL